ncbi:hypothetical protein GCM10027360_20670 [Amycolatopsis echigonensis]
MSYPPPGPPGYPGYSNYPARPGLPGPSPRKPRTGLWGGLGLGAVVLVAFLITGLVAPGFLIGGSSDWPTGEQGLPVTSTPTTLADPQPDSTEPNTPEPTTPSSTGAAAPGDSATGLALLQDFLRKVSSGNRQDQDAAAKMGCPSYRNRVEAFAVFGSGEKFSYDLAQATQTGNAVALPITGTMNGRPYAAVVTATTEDGKSCVMVDKTQ